jgi:hypothetical protein
MAKAGAAASVLFPGSAAIPFQKVTRFRFEDFHRKGLFYRLKAHIRGWRDGWFTWLFGSHNPSKGGWPCRREIVKFPPPERFLPMTRKFCLAAEKQFEGLNYE